MELEFRLRNNDFGPHFPTFQERVNSMLPAENTIAAGAAAPVIETDAAPMTPHMPNEAEVRQTIRQMEDEASRQSREAIELHSGLNAQRVARLLGLLEEPGI